MLKEKLSVRELEKRVKRVSPTKRRTTNPFITDMEERLQKSLGTKVKIVNKRNNKGKIVIEYYGADDLEKITKRIL